MCEVSRSRKCVLFYLCFPLLIAANLPLLWSAIEGWAGSGGNCSGPNFTIVSQTLNFVTWIWRLRDSESFTFPNEKLFKFLRPKVVKFCNLVASPASKSIRHPKGRSGWERKTNYSKFDLGEITSELFWWNEVLWWSKSILKPHASFLQIPMNRFEFWWIFEFVFSGSIGQFKNVMTICDFEGWKGFKAIW